MWPICCFSWWIYRSVLSVTLRSLPGKFKCLLLNSFLVLMELFSTLVWLDQIIPIYIYIYIYILRNINHYVRMTRHSTSREMTLSSFRSATTLGEGKLCILIVRDVLFRRFSGTLEHHSSFSLSKKRGWFKTNFYHYMQSTCVGRPTVHEGVSSWCNG